MQILSEVDMTMLDTTTDNASTTAHGFVPKGPNTGTQFLRDDLTWAVPAGGGGGSTIGMHLAFISTNIQL